MSVRFIEKYLQMYSTHLQKHHTAHTNPYIKFITHLCPFPISLTTC